MQNGKNNLINLLRYLSLPFALKVLDSLTTYIGLLGKYAYEKNPYFSNLLTSYGYGAYAISSMLTVLAFLPLWYTTYLFKRELAKQPESRYFNTGHKILTIGYNMFCALLVLVVINNIGVCMNLW